MFFKLRESSNFGQGVAKPLRQIFFKNGLHCGYFYWWLFCWSSASLISTFSAISTFRLVTFHRSATFCLNISTTVIFLSWWIHQLRENYCHRIKASLFHDKYWFTTALFHSIKIDFFVNTDVQRRKIVTINQMMLSPSDDVLPSVVIFSFLRFPQL